jgi:signal peptidase I
MIDQKKSYSLSKCQKIMKEVASLYKRKKKKLDDLQRKGLENLLLSLQKAIQTKNREQANQLAHAANDFSYEYLPKSFFEKTIDFFSALLFALCVAVVVRQMGFEFYVIPSGSMRPTLMENDYLIVSKSSFGVDTLWTTSHYSFDPNLIQRGNVIVFSGDKMDIPLVDTTYFLFFPGKKQYVKRLIGKPGDILYFYGGRIYGIDKEGNEIQDFKQPWFVNIEHIPFLRFEGFFPKNLLLENSSLTSIIFYQFGVPIAKLTYLPSEEFRGELFPFKNTLSATPNAIKHYYDLWGTQNFATARILSAKEAFSLFPKKPSPYYLLLTHHPDIYPGDLLRDNLGRIRPSLSTSTSLIPLSKEILERILQHLTTSRFVVKNNKVLKLNAKMESSEILMNVPDGTYEFIDGIAYCVHFLGISFQLPPSHPLYRKDPEQIAVLYNFGIDWANHSSPFNPPPRFAYFYHGDLYLMGKPILFKEELSDYVHLEKEKVLFSANYHPFLEERSPITSDGTLDKEFIRNYGLVIPPGKYLALGDNHSMSSDCRDFGFIPESNIRGKATWILWPFNRLGRIAQPTTSFFTLPHFIVWGGLLFFGLGGYFVFRWYRNRPLNF